MKAIVIGATGAVGMELLDVLIRDPHYEQVLAFAQRDPGMKAEKLRFYRVDFDRPEEWQEMVRGDVLFPHWEPRRSRLVQRKRSIISIMIIKSGLRA